MGGSSKIQIIIFLKFLAAVLTLDVHWLVTTALVAAFAPLGTVRQDSTTR